MGLFRACSNVVGIVCGYYRWQNVVYCRIV